MSADQVHLTRAKLERLALASSALLRYEDKLRAADTALGEAEQALWAAGFEKREAEHKLRDDASLDTVEMFKDRQQIVSMRIKIGAQLAEAERTRKLIEAEQRVYGSAIGI